MLAVFLIMGKEICIYISNNPDDREYGLSNNKLYSNLSEIIDILRLCENMDQRYPMSIINGIESANSLMRRATTAVTDITKMACDDNYEAVLIMTHQPIINAITNAANGCYQGIHNPVAIDAVINELTFANCFTIANITQNSILGRNNLDGYSSHENHSKYNFSVNIQSTVGHIQELLQQLQSNINYKLTPILDANTCLLEIDIEWPIHVIANILNIMSWTITYYPKNELNSTPYTIPFTSCQ